MSKHTLTWVAAMESERRTWFMPSAQISIAPYSSPPGIEIKLPRGAL